MRIRTFVCTAAAALLLASPLFAAADACCDNGACCDKACCQRAGDQAAATVLLPHKHDSVVRQSAEVWFHRPVKIGDRILLGKYIIEHDNDRMARGLPCTHIYAANKRALPVVSFYCTHLTRTRAERSTVTVYSLGDPTGMVRMTAFQFAGETAAHGVPTRR